MISASLQQRKTRTRRSMLFVPGANAAMVSNSFIYPADALMETGMPIPVEYKAYRAYQIHLIAE